MWSVRSGFRATSDFKAFSLTLFAIVFMVCSGKPVNQEEKRMWKPRAWSKEAAEKMSRFGKQPSYFTILLWCAHPGGPPVWFKHYCCGHNELVEYMDFFRFIWTCGFVTGEPAWGWARQKWATERGDRSPQEEGTAARPGQHFSPLLNFILFL